MQTNFFLRSNGSWGPDQSSSGVSGGCVMGISCPCSLWVMLQCGPGTEQMSFSPVIGHVSALEFVHALLPEQSEPGHKHSGAWCPWFCLHPWGCNHEFWKQREGLE